MTHSIIFPKNYVIDMSDAKQALKEYGERVGYQGEVEEPLVDFNEEEKAEGSITQKGLCFIYVFFLNSLLAVIIHCDWLPVK